MCSRDPGWSFYPSWVFSYAGNFSSSKSYRANTSQNPPDKLRYWIWSWLLEVRGSRPLKGRLLSHKPNLAIWIPNRQVGSWAALPAPLANYWQNTSVYNCFLKSEFWQKVQTKSGSCNFDLKLWNKLIPSYLFKLLTVCLLFVIEITQSSYGPKLTKSSD